MAAVADGPGGGASLLRLAPWLAPGAWPPVEASPPEEPRRWPAPHGTAEAERVRLQLQRLWMERRAESRRRGQFDEQLSQSRLQEQSAQRRAARQQQQLEGRRQHAAEVERKIAQVRRELEACEAAQPGAEAPSEARPPRSAAGAPRAGTASSSTSSLPPARERAGSRQEDGRTAWSSPKTGLEVALTWDAQRQRVRGADRPVSPAGSSRSGSRPCSRARGSAGAGSAAALPSAAPPARPGLGFAGPGAARGPNGAPDGRLLRQSASSPALARGSLAAPPAQRRPSSRADGRPAPAPAPQDAAAQDAEAPPPRLPGGKTAEEEEAEEAMRESVRAELVRLVGGPREAFQTFDLNRSGGISLMEFADGIARLSLNFTDLTGLQKQQSLFRLFDADRDGVITFAELFPEEAARKPELPEDAEEFVAFWFRQNRDFKQPFQGPRWEPNGPDEERQCTLDASQYAAEVAAKKKWMSSTIRRLKKRGKSDARCRELVALHLPRGTGPKDLQDVKTFSHTDYRAVRKKYTDAWSVPIKKIQKVIVDMRDIKRDLRDIRDELYMVTEGRAGRMDDDARRSVREDRRSIVSALLAPPDFEAFGDPGTAVPSPAAAAASAAPAAQASGHDAASDAPSGERDPPDEQAMVEYFRDCLAGYDQK